MCNFKIKRPIYLIKVALHAHSYGRRIGAFIKNSNNGKWDRIYENAGVIDFIKHDIEPPFRIDSDFELAIRCIYDTTSSNHSISFGGGVENEMCVVNFFYYSDDINASVKNCLSGIPTDRHPEVLSNNPLPDPLLEMMPDESPLSDTIEVIEIMPNTNAQPYNLVVFIFLTAFIFLIFIFAKLKKIK